MFGDEFMSSITFKKIVNNVELIFKREKHPKPGISVEELEQAFNMNFCKKT